MRIISKKALRQFWERHAAAEQPFLAWCKEVEQADWETPARVVDRFPKASIVRNDRVVFRFGGGYRIVTLVLYRKRLVLVRFVGTHDEYERINVEEV